MSNPAAAHPADGQQPRLYGNWRAERGWGIGRLSTTATIVVFLAVLAPLLAASTAPAAVLPLAGVGVVVVAAIVVRIGGRSAADVLGVRLRFWRARRRGWTQLSAGVLADGSARSSPIGAHRRIAVKGAAVREFADALDDRVADTVAAALLLALQQQSVGIARVLRLLADGVARDVRARRDIEAARAEFRQSIRMLLLIQAGVLAMLAVVPSFAAPYATPAGQTVMALLLAGTVALLVWMRRLALGNRPPRFLGTPAAESGMPRAAGASR
jgi:hypothetical protein